MRLVLLLAHAATTIHRHTKLPSHRTSGAEGSVAGVTNDTAMMRLPEAPKPAIAVFIAQTRLRMIKRAARSLAASRDRRRERRAE